MTATTGASPPGVGTNGPSGIAAWALFDWANSAFNTVIGTFVFSVYFARGIYGDETQGSALWGYAIGAAGIAVALLSPVLGAIADRGGSRKPWVGAFVALCCLATAALWFAEPDPAFVLYTLVLVALASVAHELSIVFTNAMLPAVAPTGMTGRVSGWAWGLGYIGGLGCLALVLVALVLPDTPWFGLSTDDSENIRATALVVALWFALFSLPLFLLTRDVPGEGLAPAVAVRRGLAVLVQTLRTVRRYGQIVRFLIASALYRDGLGTLFAMGGIYAAGTFGMGFQEILIFAIGLNVTAGLGAAAFAFLDDRAGSKLTVLVALAGLIAAGIPLLLIDDQTVFIGLALVLGLFVGPAQAASRSFMARLSPPDMTTEMFGLYALTGKSIAFLGPVLFGALTTAFDSQRAGMAIVVVFFVLGGLVLLTVRDPGRDPSPGPPSAPPPAA